MTLVPSLSLPIDAALPALSAALRERNASVLVAPPGAGKTTRVPLALLDHTWVGDGKILVLEPRRLAARAAAARMASTLGEEIGATVGYRVRFGSKVSRATRIEVVTEGIFTRMISDDPSLPGIAAVLFDEFHERSLDADVGLALARDAQAGLREDLRLLVMSATIDGARIAKLLGDAPVVEAQGRSFPVETRYLGRDMRAPIEPQVADAVMRALRAEPGSALVFLPGMAEIRRTETLLRQRISDPSVDVTPLYGALEAGVQDRAIAPSPPGRRKIVLATSIAETSLTIDGVRVVVDSGLARVPRYEPDVGLTRLETVRVSRAAADQRRGRAGRTEPGVCYRLWDEPQTVALEPFGRPEILSADLAQFALDLAQWGVNDPDTLALLDPPPKGALAQARMLLWELGALDRDNRITDHGRRLRDLPLPPRLAHMIVEAERNGMAGLAADIALVLTERGLGGADVDLRHRLDQLRRDSSNRSREARRSARRWIASGTASDAGGTEGAGVVLAAAYPDRIAKGRGGDGQFLLANGRGASVDPASPLAREPFLAVAEVTGSAAQSRILLAAPIAPAEIEAAFAARIEERTEIIFEPESASVRARETRRLGAIVLRERIGKPVPNEQTTTLLLDGVRRIGIAKLPWTKSLAQWRDRVMFLRRAQGEESDWPDLGETALAATLDQWLGPALDGKTALAELAADAFANALQSLLDWPLRRRLDEDAPTHFEAPTGTRVAIDYEAEAGPTIAIRVQELFGLAQHPSLARGRIPLVIELLSPAHRPVQVTRDLPGFWRGSYAAVRTEMRGRYPRHPWPDDPLSAPATRRAKPRGT